MFISIDVTYLNFQEAKWTLISRQRLQIDLTIVNGRNKVRTRYKENIVDLYIVTNIFIADYSRVTLATISGRNDSGRKDDHGMIPWGGAIYIFGDAEDHGLSRGNGIFEARRSRKAITPKAVLIKAQPRYIAAMPHTPICPPPPRTSPYPYRSYRPFFRNFPLFLPSR